MCKVAAQNLRAGEVCGDREEVLSGNVEVRGDVDGGDKYRIFGD